MDTASQLRAKLKKGGFGVDEAERIVKGEIASGSVADDGFAGSVPIDMLIEAAEALRGVSEPDEPYRASGIAKGGPASMDEDVSDMLRATASNSESLLDYQRDTLPVIAKGVLAHGQVIESLVGAVTSLESIVKGMAAKLNEPVAPRGLTGATPVPHPSERKNPAAPGAVSRDALTKALRLKQREMIAKGDPNLDKDIERVGDAVSALENTFASPAQVIRTFDIDIT